MDFQQYKFKIILLLALVVPGIVYCGWVYSQRTLTGIDKWDGIVGVVLGLYICSHPAANLVDMLFFIRGRRSPFPSSKSVVSWFALNTLVLFIAGVVIFVGTTRLIGRTG
jgi:hypothetical protein